MNYNHYKKIIWGCLVLIASLALFLLSGLPQQLAASGEPPSGMLIIDPGHGGEDGGAVALNGTLESDLNLDVALRLKALTDFWGVSSLLTRETNELDYPSDAETLSEKKKADQNARVALVESTPGAILMSIHQNYYPSAAPWGIQVFYGTISGSEYLAKITQSNLTTQLAPDNRRIATTIDESIYLMRSIQCPAILVECGFISNADDLKKLETEQYRTELAAVLLASYLQYTEGITA